MAGGFLVNISTGLLAVVVLVVGAGISEATFRIGRRRRRDLDEPARASLNTIGTALLALIGLLLAFSLSMSVNRFDARRELLIEETNAIGTAWLRSGIAPEPIRSHLRSHLENYARSRVTLFELPNYGAFALGSKGEELRQSIWDEASKFAEGEPRSIPAGLLVQSVNEMIDLHTRRDAATLNQVPEPVWGLLIGITFIALGAVGFNDAQGSRSNLAARILLAAALAATLALTMDLDRPRRGLIRISQEPMRELAESFGRPP